MGWDFLKNNLGYHNFDECSLHWLLQTYYTCLQTYYTFLQTDYHFLILLYIFIHYCILLYILYIIRRPLWGHQACGSPVWSFHPSCCPPLGACETTFSSHAPPCRKPIESVKLYIFGVWSRISLREHVKNAFPPPKNHFLNDLCWIFLLPY